jgi:hypothetical protein
MESNQTSASFFGPLLAVVGLGPAMLLDAFVKMTGYARKSVSWLLGTSVLKRGNLYSRSIGTY